MKLSKWARSLLLQDLGTRVSYNSITSTKSPSFCTRTFRASLTNLTLLLPRPRDCSCYASRPILAPPPLWLQTHTDLRAHNFAHSPHFWHQARLANFTCAWSWSLNGNNVLIHTSRYRHRLWFWWSPVRLHSIEFHPTERFNPRITNMGLVPPWHQSGSKTGVTQNLTTLPVRHTLRVSPVPHTTHKNSGSYAPSSRHAASNGSSRFGSHTTASRYSQWADIRVPTPIYCQYKNAFRFFKQKNTQSYSL